VRGGADCEENRLYSTSDGLVARCTIPCRQEPLDISQAEAEDVVRPRHAADDPGGGSMIIVRIVGNRMPPISPTSGLAAKLG